MPRRKKKKPKAKNYYYVLQSEERSLLQENRDRRQAEGTLREQRRGDWIYVSEEDTQDQNQAQNQEDRPVETRTWCRVS
jgi:hypothetical protein